MQELPNPVFPSMALTMRSRKCLDSWVAVSAWTCNKSSPRGLVPSGETALLMDDPTLAGRGPVTRACRTVSHMSGTLSIFSCSITLTPIRTPTLHQHHHADLLSIQFLITLLSPINIRIVAGRFMMTLINLSTSVVPSWGFQPRFRGSRAEMPQAYFFIWTTWDPCCLSVVASWGYQSENSGVFHSGFSIAPKQSQWSEISPIRALCTTSKKSKYPSIKC